MAWLITLPLIVLVGYALSRWVTNLVAGRPIVAGPARPEGPPQEPSGPPPLDDPRRLRLYVLENALNSGPAVSLPDELLDMPAFREMVKLLSGEAFDDETLAAYATGERAAPAWAALVALTGRPRNESIARRAYRWLGMFVPWSREFILRLLEAWYPEDPALTGRVLVALDREWALHPAFHFVLERFLRRQAAGAPLTLGGQFPEDAERLADARAILATIDPELAAPLLAELDERECEEPGPAALATRPPAPPPVVPPAAGANPRLAGRRSKPGAFTAPVLYPRESLAQARERALRALRADPARSVLVTGDPGTGKTSLARALAAALSRDGWRILETSPMELNAGMSFVGQLEGRIHELIEESSPAHGARTAWLVRDFHLLIGLGRSFNNAQGALDMILPAIESGRLLVIGECRGVAAETLFAERPELQRLVELVRLAPPRDEELDGIARAWLGTLPAGEAGRVAAGTLEEAVSLARHHLGALGMPSGLLRLLERAREAAGDGEAAGPVGPAALLRALAELTGLPPDLLDEHVPLDTRALRERFGSRVLGQDEAVRALVDRLALMKAGVTHPHKPYAVFLFAGPTGTGKTELVKALAGWLFGSVERLVRLDMSELQDAGAMSRLLDAADTTGGGSLVARVRRQPFSVVLLDEFEKAHPRVWDLFLQVFDDGRLTDSRGETVDFRSTFIVMTSNLGSRLQGNERLGFTGGDDFSAREVLRAVGQAFRPEFLNRLDRVVVFRPLSREVMREILRKQAAEAFRRRGLRRREWAVEIEESAIEFLLDRGFTTDLGARPLQRALEQHLLAPLARTIVERRAPARGQFLFVRADGDRLAVEFVDPESPDAAPPAPAAPGRAGSGRDLRAIAWESYGEPAELAALRTALEALAGRVGTEAWTERKHALLAETGVTGFWQRDDRFEVLGRAEFMDRIEAGMRSARSVLARLEGESRHATYPPPLLRRLARQLLLIAIAADEAGAGGPRDAFLSVESGHDAGDPAAAAAWRDRLVAMYEAWARERGMRVAELDPARAVGTRGTTARRLAVSGFGAWATLAGEAGLHVLEAGTPATGGTRVAARVRVAVQPPRPARDAAELSRQAAEHLAAAEAGAQVVRHYRESPAPLARDHVRAWRTGRVERVLAGDFDLVPAGDGEGEGA